MHQNSDVQRKYETLQLWLLASGRAAQPLSPIETLFCLRACLCGVDVSTLKVDELKAQLAQRGLQQTGLEADLRIRLNDELSMRSAMPCEEEVACKAMTKMAAYRFREAVDDESLFTLDAASFPDVLAQESLNIGSEAELLKHTTQWTSMAGRTDQTIDRVFPLIRFPRVPTLLSPGPELKALKQVPFSIPIFHLVNQCSRLIIDALRARFKCNLTQSDALAAVYHCGYCARLIQYGLSFLFKWALA